MIIEKKHFFPLVQSGQSSKIVSRISPMHVHDRGVRDDMDSIMKCRRRYPAKKAILAGVWSCCFGISVLAAEIPWPQKSRFQYLAQKKDLRELLREFSVSQGLTVAIAEGVDGSVSGRFDLKPQAMLELLAASHGFLWYYDGSLLHVSPSTDVRTEVIPLRHASADQIATTLARLDVLDRRYPLHLDKDASTILVSGPGRYVELVRQIAENMETRHGQNHPAEVRVFPLRFAWAADHEFSSGGRTIVVPGVASTLNALYKPAAVIAQQSQNAQVKKASPLKSLSADAAPGAQAGGASAKADNARQGATQDTQESFPVIQASAQINSVIIRDSAGRMAQYEGLIEKLDVRPAMIEIEARVIEVSSDEADKLGVDWRIGANPTPGLDNSLRRLDAVRNFTNGGGVMKSILANAGLTLLQQISMLEAKGKASVSASPTVLTLNNLEARMDNQESFYVRVAGYQSSELFNVTAGVTLRVTPMIVGGGARQRIKLDVRIEDGRIDATQTVDQIPTVNRSEITTQGFVNNGESLLIAGYSAEQDTNQTANVPGLSRIPLLGGLFRNKAMAKLKTQRLFLLTPRIVEEPQEDQPIAKPSLNRELGIDGITLKPDTALNVREQLKSARKPEPADASPPVAASETAAAPTAAPEKTPVAADASPLRAAKEIPAAPAAAPEKPPVAAEASPLKPAKEIPAAPAAAPETTPVAAEASPFKAAKETPAAPTAAPEKPPVAAEASPLKAAKEIPAAPAAAPETTPVAAEASPLKAVKEIPAAPAAAPEKTPVAAEASPLRAAKETPAAPAAAPEKNPLSAGASPLAAAKETPASHAAITETKPEKISAEWQISSADNTLKSALSRWSAHAGWQLSWELPVDYPIQARTTITGSFEEAVEAVAMSMDDARFPIKAIFYRANKVLRFVVRGME